MKVLLAGATGRIGRAALDVLLQRGHRVRALTRREGMELDCEVVVADATREGALAGACAGVEIVVSAMGASLGFDLSERRSYDDVDLAGNLALLAEARRAGVGRLVSVGTFTPPGFELTRYARAHRALADALAASPLSTTVIQPAGVFSACDELLEAARRGKVWIAGDGSSRSNPIHPTDVARQIVDHLEQGPAGLPVGGPEVLTRREMAEKAFVALGQPPRIARVPALALRWFAPLLGRAQPRLGDWLELVAAASAHDSIAPRNGTRTLAEYFSATLSED